MPSKTRPGVVLPVWTNPAPSGRAHDAPMAGRHGFHGEERDDEAASGTEALPMPKIFMSLAFPIMAGDHQGGGFPVLVTG